ncbi:hypothetical protein NHX12_015310 [Muraenolepis orangiensis]|uniref:Uncharacterized protein n=1 Tax=Muraenolepis orangiensis TaxID=630683 RepID=A0A9Q0I4E4_9TELE|nr:hypothetical protein NHX12_015310 [Muraenolepis orangiensis]
MRDPCHFPAPDVTWGNPEPNVLAGHIPNTAWVPGLAGLVCSVAARISSVTSVSQAGLNSSSPLGTATLTSRELSPGHPPPTGPTHSPSPRPCPMPTAGSGVLQLYLYP